SFTAKVTPGQYRLAIDDYPDQEGESNDTYGWSAASDLIDLTGNTTLNLTLPQPATAGIDFVDGEGQPMSGNVAPAASSTPGAIALTSTLHATTSGGASSMGDVTGSPFPFVGPSTVAGTFEFDNPNSDGPITFANLPLTADGDIIIAAPAGVEPHS